MLQQTVQMYEDVVESAKCYFMQSTRQHLPFSSPLYLTQAKKNLILSQEYLHTRLKKKLEK